MHSRRLNISVTALPINENRSMGATRLETARTYYGCDPGDFFLRLLSLLPQGNSWAGVVPYLDPSAGAKKALDVPRVKLHGKAQDYDQPIVQSEMCWTGEQSQPQNRRPERCC